MSHLQEPLAIAVIYRGKNYFPVAHLCKCRFRQLMM